MSQNPPRGFKAFLSDMEEVERLFAKSTDRRLKPLFIKGIQRALGETRPEHKYNNRGGLRSPLPVQGPLGPMAYGSRTEREAYIAVKRENLGISGPTAGTVRYAISGGSKAKTADGRFFTLGLIEHGHRGAGVIRRRVTFWGRRTGEGPVTVRQFRHVAVAGKKFVRKVATPEVKAGVQDDLANAIRRAFREGRGRGFRMRIQTTVKP